MKKSNPKEKRFFGVFKTFEDFENYIAREEEPTLDFLSDMHLLTPVLLRFLANIGMTNIRKN